MIKRHEFFKVLVIAFILVSLIITPKSYAGGDVVIDADYLYLEEYRGLVNTVLDVKVTGTLEGNAWGTTIYSDDSDIGYAAVHAGILKVGETKTVKITVLPGQSSYVGSFKNGLESYDYETWEGSFKFNDDTQAIETPTPPVEKDENISDGNISSEVFKEGVIMSWESKGVLGYRIFRSTTENELGISVTDFYITGNSYADVNVEPNTTYYYTIKPVLVEADPIKGIEEVLGDAIGKYTIKTGSEITKSENAKNFIVLQIDNPNMSVNGKIQEIDPGRGTTPIVISSRSMVPIRAIVEAMGGSVGWDSNTQQITLTANGNTVKMWVGKKAITVNGENREMDVAPIIQNGRTYVPVRFAAENLNAKVDWINSTREAVITYEVKKNEFLSDTKIPTTSEPIESENETKPEVTIDPEMTIDPEIAIVPEVTNDPDTTKDPEITKETKTSGGQETTKDLQNNRNSDTSQYSVPKQPVFFMEDGFQLLDGNQGKVTFRLQRPISLGEYTGFRVYFTEDGVSEIYEFAEDTFAYTEKIGKTIDISITTVNGTVESTPQNLSFTMLDRIVGNTIWSERQTDDLFGSPCWYGLSWKPVEGASKYKVYVSGDVRSYMNFINYRDLTGFSEMIVTGTSFSTKSNTGLPAAIVNASWGESRYVVVFPMNEDGVRGPFPKYFEITMTGVSSPAHF